MGTPEIIEIKNLTFKNLLKPLLMNMPDVVFVVERKRKV
jgi:type II secretory ATPase GspE/PulE/Tfp pilus assembly ATPase PilB-like protein